MTVYQGSIISMMTSPNGNIFRVTGEFTGPRWIPRTKASDAQLDVFFNLRLNKRLSKQSWSWLLETLLRLLWRHCNECDTRNRDQIHVDRTRTRYADKRIHIYLPIVLNSTPTALLAQIAAHSLQGFAFNRNTLIFWHLLHSELLHCRHNLTWFVIVVLCVAFPCSFVYSFL